MPMRVSSQFQEDLLGHHESGMGYQIAEISHTWHLIFNAEVAVQIQLEGHLITNQSEWSRPLGDWLNGADISWLNDRAESAAAPPATIEELELGELEGSVSYVHTHGSYASASRQGELFVRYSAFHPDFRINPDGSVRPGTYVTTATDMSHVPSGLAAVGRYALPNPAPALYAFMMLPPLGVSVHCGTVAPKYGQAGGGVEVQFNAPLPAGTASGSYVIPER